MCIALYVSFYTVEFAIKEGLFLIFYYIILFRYYCFVLIKHYIVWFCIIPCNRYNRCHGVTV
jgi:hypothetical protein